MNHSRNYVKTRQFAGWSLLLISFGMGLIVINMGQFGDEADNLVVGNLLLKNYTLYKDVFSHHFPVPYYWSAFIIGLFGKSIFIVRLSVLIFQTVAFAISMRLSRDYLLIGTTALLWNIIKLYYMGQMILYNTFASIALTVVLLVTITLLLKPTLPNWKHFLTIGLFSVIAFLSDPLSIYPIAIVLLFIFTKKPIWGIYISLIIISGVSIYFGHLLLSDTLQSFWNNAILFNSEIYAQYTYTNPLRINKLIQIVSKGFEITDKTWNFFHPFKLTTEEFANLNWQASADFLFSVSILATTLLFVLGKKFRAASFLYLFAASTLIIDKRGFHIQSFILISLVTVSALITHDWWRQTNNKRLKTTQIVVGILTLLLTGWICSILLTNTFNVFESFRNTPFSNFEEDSIYIQELTCNHPNVVLAHYPVGTYYYWFTDMEPVSKFVFMWPWVADIGLTEVMEELRQDQTLAIVIRQDLNIWGKYDTKEYLLPLDQFLETNYQQVGDGIYVSPALYSICPN